MKKPLVICTLFFFITTNSLSQNLVAPPDMNAEALPCCDKRFSLPLADGTDAEAVFLPASDSGLHLVYATRFGKLMVLHVSHEEPEPGPIPPDPPVPVTSLQVAVVHTPLESTIDQRRIMADPAWRSALPSPHKFSGIIPADYVDPNTNTTPDAQAKFIKAAGETPLPCLVLLNENDSTIFVCPLPESAGAILKLIEKYGGKTNVNPDNRRRKLQTSTRRTSGSVLSQSLPRYAGMLNASHPLRSSPTRSQGHRDNQAHPTRGLARIDCSGQGNLAT